MKLREALATLLFLSAWAGAAGPEPGSEFVSVYAGPEGIAASDDYAVAVVQGETRQTSFTYKNRCDDPADERINREFMQGIEDTPALKKFYFGDSQSEAAGATASAPAASGNEAGPVRQRSVSWTTFSFQGTATVQVRSLKGAIETAKILPSSRGIEGRVVKGELTFTLAEPTKLAIIVNGNYIDPLFLFADGPELSSPDSKTGGVVAFRAGDDYQGRLDEVGRARVVYFQPGVHDIGVAFPVSSNQTIYLAGGAYVRGTFQGVMANNVTFRGRGIISGELIPRSIKNQTRGVMNQFKLHAISMLNEENRQGAWNPHCRQIGQGCDNLLVEGITIVDPGHFFLRLAGVPITVHNVKMIGGWHYNSDGVSAIGAAHTTVFDCFFQCNDDAIYISPSFVHVHHCVFWQNDNGAVFQFSWGGDAYPQGGGYIHDCDIIHEGTTREANNRAIIGSRKSGPGDIRNILFKNIRIEGAVWRIFRLNTYGGRGELGSIYDITFENITVNGPVIHKSEIMAGVGAAQGQLGADSWVRDITFKNVSINGRPLTKDDFILGLQNVKNIEIRNGQDD